MTDFTPLVQVALDLTSSLMAGDRYERLIKAVAFVTPSNATCLLRLEGAELVPLAASGLVPEVVGRRFVPREHPRLEVIASSAEPVRFPMESPLPDPFDGLVEGDPHALDHIHACIGCPLNVDGQLVGVLTLDALEPHAFDELDPKLLTMLAALAGAALHTSSLIEALESGAAHQGMVARELLRETIVASAATELIGASRPIRELREEIELVGRTDYPVLICGESGTGKELVARAVHQASTRSQQALIQVNCAALPEAMAESELFGHVRGAFTGAQNDRAGKLSVAHGGTLVLDEIGELPLALQPKLLRTLQEGEIQRVGEDEVRQVNVRILASTNRDLEREVAAGRFRADLYHRLNVYPLYVPALRERREDIAQLTGHFSQLAARRVGTGTVRFSDGVREALYAAEWPGNVRELKNAVSRMVLRASAGRSSGIPVVVEDSHLASAESAGLGERRQLTFKHASPEEGQGQVPMRAAVEDFQRQLIQDTVARTNQNWSAAARELGMHRSNLHHLAVRLGMR